MKRQNSCDKMKRRPRKTGTRFSFSRRMRPSKHTAHAKHTTQFSTTQRLFSWAMMRQKRCFARVQFNIVATHKSRWKFFLSTQGIFTCSEYKQARRTEPSCHDTRELSGFRKTVKTHYLLTKQKLCLHNFGFQEKSVLNKTLSHQLFFHGITCG